MGRDDELARMESLLVYALTGHGRLVLCTGEAGIGKTRLAEELAASAVGHGAVVVWARSTDPASSPPYGIWRLVIDELANGSADIGRLSELRGMLEQPTPSDGFESASSQRFALFTLLRTALRRAANDTGLVVILDDLHWADEAVQVRTTVRSGAKTGEHTHSDRALGSHTTERGLWFRSQNESTTSSSSRHWRCLDAGLRSVSSVGVDEGGQFENGRLPEAVRRSRPARKME